MIGAVVPCEPCARAYQALLGLSSSLHEPSPPSFRDQFTMPWHHLQKRSAQALILDPCGALLQQVVVGAQDTTGAWVFIGPQDLGAGQPDAEGLVGPFSVWACRCSRMGSTCCKASDLTPWASATRVSPA